MQLLQKDKLPTILLIFLGSLSWSLTMVKSGIIYPYGMGFWGPNGHDGIWHIALINHLAKGSFEMPIFAGERIRNYHIGFDLTLAWIHKLTNIPAHNLYFQVLPPILAILVGYLTYKFVLAWRGSKTEAFWATFFVYFAGDFGWIVTLVRNGNFGGESLFWSQQAVSTLVNPPFAMSLVLILASLIFLLKLTEKFNIKYLLLCILLFGVLAQIKIYAGILMLGALGLTIPYSLLRYKNVAKVFIIGVILVASAVFSLLLFLPLNSGSQKMVVFQPFWFLETMMAVSDRFGWQKFYEALMNYKTGHIWIKLIPAYIVAFIIFFVGNMGMRVIGLYSVLREGMQKRLGEIDVFLLGVALLGTLLPMCILQTGTPWNTIQFFYYSLFVFAIYTGVWVGRFAERAKMTHISVYDPRIWLIILITIPTTLSTLMNSYLPGRPPAKISNQELEALNFLKSQENGVVLTYPFDKYKADLAVNNPPRPLYLYESTAYVSAFSGKVVFLENEVNLDITGFQWRHRREQSKIPLTSYDKSEVSGFLTKNKIKYLYLVLSQTPVFGQRFRLGESQLGLKNIFENNEVVIYRVN
mgnify:CR=1 FL=1